MTTALAAADATRRRSRTTSPIPRCPPSTIAPRSGRTATCRRPRRSSSPSSLVFGGAVHAALDRIHQSWLAGLPVTAAGAMESYDAHWHADSSLAEVRFGKGEDRGACGGRPTDWSRFICRTRGRRPHPGGRGAGPPCAPGMPVPVEGRVDLVVETEDAMTVVDAKTGRAIGADRAAQATGQLALYADALLPLARDLGKAAAGTVRRPAPAQETQD